MNSTLSSELQAMVQVEAALKDLEEEERNRVMQWALSRFGALLKPQVAFAPHDVQGQESSEDVGHSDQVEYEDLATFYDAASPDNDMEKALACSYWLQFYEGATDIDAQSVNTQLKHLGHGISNVTRAFDGLKAQKPALIIQLRKEGSTKQARKRFKVTVEGRKVIDRMLTRMK